MNVVEKKNIFNSILVFIFGIVVLVSLIVPYDYELFYSYLYLSYGFYFNLICGLLMLGLYFFSYRGKLYKEDVVLLLLILLFEVYVVISAHVVNGGLRYAGIILNTLVYTYVLRRINISPRAYRIFFVIAFILLLVYALGSKDYYDRQFSNGGEFIDVNSNYIGTLAVVLLIYLFICSKYFEQKTYVKVLCLFACAVSLYIIIGCKSRSSLGAWGVFVLLYYVVPKKVLIKKWVAYTLFSIVLAFDFMFPFVYAKYMSFFRTINMMGRTALTRTTIYKYVIEHIGETSKSLMLGHGTYGAMGKTFTYQVAHNTFYQIWYDLGLIGVIFIVIFFYVIFHQFFGEKKEIDAKQIVAYIGIVSYVFLEGFSVSFRTGLAIWGYIILGEMLKPLPDYNVVTEKQYINWNSNEY